MIAERALTMDREHRRPILSERATLAPFDALADETRPLQHDPREGRCFSLANIPIVCQARDMQFAPAHPSRRLHGGGQLKMLMAAITRNLAAGDHRPCS